MKRDTAGIVVVLPMVLLGLMGSVPAAAQTVLFDQDYAFVPTKQRDVVVRRIHRLLAPTISFPAMARAGGTLEVLIRAARGPQGKLLEPAQTTLWQVYLLRRGAKPAHRCRVLRVKLSGKNLLLSAELPVHLARDVYDLRIMGPGVDESQPNAVRVLGHQRSDTFRFAMVADHQLWDPSYRISGRGREAGEVPRPVKEAKNIAVARQGFAELALLDPDFVINAGDMVFGVDFPREYEHARNLMRDARLPVYAIPGNHDGYADYVVKLRGGALTIVSGAVGCKRHLEGEITWGKAWVFITCVYGDVKDLLYADLHRDGLIYWRRQLGPMTYAFDRGQMRFVGLNTYGGTPERRHAFSIYMDAFDLRLGVPAVDNYGGYLTQKQLDFVRAEARRAARAGKTLVVFGHHDPRGNARGNRYHPNEAFPTDPLSMSGFEEWNYDSRVWDSDRSDTRAAETATSHSGLQLLQILAEHGGYYLCGHAHHDDRTVYKPGSMVRGIQVKQRLEIIRATTASAGCTRRGYWGYRLLQVEGRRITRADYDLPRGLASVPVGNLWVRHTPGPPHEVFLHSHLPQPTPVTVTVTLPQSDSGYRFRLRPAEIEAGGVPPRIEPPRVLQVRHERGKMVFWVEVKMQAAHFPPRPRTTVRRILRALRARDNSAPVAVIEAAAAGTNQLQSPEGGFDAVVGQPLLLSAERSHDEQGDRILDYLWDFGDGKMGRGPKVAHAFTTPGKRTIKLTLVDQTGVRSSALRVVKIQHPPPPPGCKGCCTTVELPSGVAGALLAVLALASVGAWRRRRRNKR